MVVEIPWFVYWRYIVRYVFSVLLFSLKTKYYVCVRSWNISLLAKIKNCLDVRYLWFRYWPIVPRLERRSQDSQLERDMM